MAMFTMKLSIKKRPPLILGWWDFKSLPYPVGTKIEATEKSRFLGRSLQHEVDV